MAPARTAAAGRLRKSPRRSSGPPRTRGGRIRWDRVARISLLIVMALILLSYIGPAAKYVDAWKLSHETKGELTTLQTEHKQLKKRHKQLKDPRYIEIEARRLGMAKPGEKVYVIKDRRRPK